MLRGRKNWGRRYVDKWWAWGMVSYLAYTSSQTPSYKTPVSSVSLDQAEIGQGQLFARASKRHHYRRANSHALARCVYNARHHARTLFKLDQGDNKRHILREWTECLVSDCIRVDRALAAGYHPLQLISVAMGAHRAS